MNYKLIDEIIKRSESKIWDTAKLEWYLNDIELSYDFSSCLCSHPIKELCFIRNKLNSSDAIVGNCCVTKFFNFGTKTIFKSIKKITKDKSKSFNSVDLIFLFNNKKITEWEYNFYSDIINKKKLSPRQKEKKIQVNEKILNILTNSYSKR